MAPTSPNVGQLYISRASVFPSQRPSSTRNCLIPDSPSTCHCLRKTKVEQIIRPAEFTDTARANYSFSSSFWQTKVYARVRTRWKSSAKTMLIVYSYIPIVAKNNEGERMESLGVSQSIASHRGLTSYQVTFSNDAHLHLTETRT